MATARDLKADALLWTLAVVVWMYVWRFQGLFPVFATTKVTLLSMCAALFLFAGDNHPGRGLRRLDSPVTRAVLGMLVLIVISTPFSVYRRASFEFLTTDFLLNLAMMVLVAASIRTPRDIDWHIRAFMFGCVVYTGVSMRVSRGERLSGKGYYDANDLGALLVCSIPLVVYLLRGTSSRLWRVLGVAFLGLLLIATIRTQSRGAFVGVIGVGVFLLVAYRSIPIGTRLAVATAGTLLFGLAAGPTYWERMATILEPSDDYNFSGQNVSGRMEIWKRGLGYMVSNPVGVGPFAFPYAEGRSATAKERLEQGQGFKWSAAHNSFVQIGAELGIGGLLLMVLALWGGMRRLWRASKRRAPGLPKSSLAILGGLVGFVVAGFFVSFAYSSLLFWLFGMTIGIIKFDRQQALDANSGAPAPLRSRHSSVARSRHGSPSDAF